MVKKGLIFVVTKKQLLDLAIQVANKNRKANELQKELEDKLTQYLGYEDRDDYVDKNYQDWSDWFIDRIENGSLDITMKDIDIIIDELKQKK